MSNIEECIMDIIKTFDNCSGIYNENDISICEIIEDFFESHGIKQYECDTELMFTNPGVDIYSFSCCWIENGELKSILNIEFDRI